ncbi:MAG TPA: diaminopimelate decarboxylase [Candidatus Cybelea sp.]
MTSLLGWQGELAPGHRRDNGGELLLGEVPARELAYRYGTPLLVIDLGVVDDAVRALTDSAAASGAEVSYAAKAFATTEFLRHLAAHPIGVDVCSLGELVTAERAGFSPERITLHGAGKSDEELAAAAAGRLGRIVVDGLEELARLAAFSQAASRVNVMLRLNVGIEAGSHAYVRTGGNDTKFGIHLRDEHAAAALIRNNPQLHFAGLHAHIGSQIYESAAYAQNASALVEAAGRFADVGLNSEQIVIGGGFGVPSHPGAVPEQLEVETAIAGAAESLRAAAVARSLPVPRLGLEPGRAIIALAGTTLYRVLAVKRQSERTFLVVDGGVGENPRPALYGAYHHVVTVSPVSGTGEDMTLCGRSCENDELGNVRLPGGIAAGALVAMCSTGAYTYSMAGNYNRIPRPAVVGVHEGLSRPLARRESVEDILRNDAV